MKVKRRQNNSKNLLLITPFFHPHQGGVEKHVLKTTSLLQKQGWQIQIITQRHNQALPKQELFQGLNVHRFSFPAVKLLGLLSIWLTLFTKYFSLFQQAQVMQVHDVMLWCLPLRLLFPSKKFVLTVHGWEGVYPIPKKNIFLKRLSVWLANHSVCVGAYLEKYYGIKCDQVIEGAVEPQKITQPICRSTNNQFLLTYLGRLASDTGLPMLLEAWHKLPKAVQQQWQISFIGQGELQSDCNRVGKVLGELNEVEIQQQLGQSKVCLASGYLSALEAIVMGCLVVVCADNQLKKDYWQLSRLVSKVTILNSVDELVQSLQSDQLLKESKKQLQQNQVDLAWIKQFSWSKVAQVYTRLYAG